MDQGTELCNFLNAELPPGVLEPREVAARLQEFRPRLLSPLAYKVGAGAIGPDERTPRSDQAAALPAVGAGAG
jgi:hypothetical protein